ncbi:hypothetical protein PIB30_004020 [Stylosanthes scabra]|uniref:Uncharacterized protein n=1 Tax=Stylosanthes scabra TaxID=79078 RepID=A0ABU6X1H5_9FABA|nr:hypothetical protein [Stylosanthes scabra]
MGAPISDQEHTNVILDGLGNEYHPFITSINNREPPLSIPDLEASLMAEEELIKRLKKPDTTMVQVNVSQTANQNSRSNKQKVNKAIGIQTITTTGTTIIKTKGFREGATRPPSPNSNLKLYPIKIKST